MRWRTPRCGALAERPRKRADGSSLGNVDSGGVPGRMNRRSPLLREACPPDSGLLLPAGEPERVIRIRFAIGITFTWPATPRLFSAGQGTVENFLRELVAGKARR